MIVQIIIFGFITGLVATIAMTASQYIEIAITRRAPSLTPARIVSNLFRFDLESFQEKNKWRLNNLVHWSYGIVWGVPLAFIYSFFELSLVPAIIIFSLVFWIQALIVVPASGAVPPVWRWEAKWIGLDALFHFIYGVVAALIYALLISF